LIFLSPVAWFLLTAASILRDDIQKRREQAAANKIAKAIAAERLRVELRREDDDRQERELMEGKKRRAYAREEKRRAAEKEEKRRADEKRLVRERARREGS
jgi:hypothetical protein